MNLIPLNKMNWIFRRSFFLYIIIYLIAMAIIHFDVIERQYSRYLGWKYTASGFQDPTSCILYYDSINHLYPLNADGYTELGRCYYQMREFENAVDAYKKAVVLAPDCHLFRRELADIYISLGLKDEATALFKTSNHQ